MLQIGSGKLYKNGIGRENSLTGVIYTNLSIFTEEKICTAAGSFLPSNSLSDPMTLFYEFNEKIEKQEIGPGVIASHGISSYISDFSTILSFALNCIATPDHDLATRLKSNKRGLLTSLSPYKVISRFFDPEIIARNEDIEYFVTFVEHLLGLDRKTYLGVMRAIRTFVTGMHRVGDDLELAYTLIVASIESLAQDFDEFETSWGDLPDIKRSKYDLALENADEDLKENVKTTIIELEHTALSRRFKMFAKKHLVDSFFREETVGVTVPIAKSDLNEGLKHAYIARSKYIHNLRELPRLLKRSGTTSEISIIENKTWFTLQGLSRLARHIITEFIYRQPTFESQEYEYFLECAGIMQAPMAPQYWIYETENFDPKSAPKRLEGFLQQLCHHWLNPEDSNITNMTSFLLFLEKKIMRIKKQFRNQLFLLYSIFNGFLPEDKQLKGLKGSIESLKKDLEEPSSEALVYNIIFQKLPTWEIPIHKNAINEYFQKRHNKTSFRVPRLLEAGFHLSLAERYRQEKDYDNARGCISSAVENYPESQNLRIFEAQFSSNVELEISFEQIFLIETNGEK